MKYHKKTKIRLARVGNKSEKKPEFRHLNNITILPLERSGNSKGMWPPDDGVSATHVHWTKDRAPLRNVAAAFSMKYLEIDVLEPSHERRINTYWGPGSKH